MKKKLLPFGLDPFLEGEKSLTELPPPESVSLHPTNFLKSFKYIMKKNVTRIYKS